MEEASTVMEEALQIQLSERYLSQFKSVLESNATREVKLEEGSFYLQKFLKKGPIFTETFHQLCEYIISKSMLEIFRYEPRGIELFRRALVDIEIKEKTLYLLHSNGFNFNASDHYGYIALDWLICGENGHCLPLMAGLGVDLKSTNGNKENLLFVAVRSGKLEIVKYLLSIGIEVNQVNDDDGWNAFHVLLEPYGRSKVVEMVTLLIQNGIDVNAKDKYGKTPLFYAFKCSEYAGMSDDMLTAIKLVIPKCSKPYYANGADRTKMVRGLVQGVVQYPAEAKFREVLELLGEKELVRLLDRVGYKKTRSRILCKVDKDWSYSKCTCNIA